MHRVRQRFLLFLVAQYGPKIMYRITELRAPSSIPNYRTTNRNLLIQKFTNPFHSNSPFIFCILKMEDWKGLVRLKQYAHYVIILACLIAIFFLYNEQLAAVPLLILSAYLFFLGFKRLREMKKR